MASQKQELLGLYLDRLRGSEDSDPDVRVRIAEQAQISELRAKLFTAANEAYLYKKPFKNPLTNKDRAWLYKIASRPAVFFTPDTPTQAKNLLSDIDKTFAKLREKNITISGDDNPPEIQGRQAARQILDRAADAKTISRADLKKAIQLYAGRQATPSEQAAVGSKMLDFISKKQVKLT